MNKLKNNLQVNVTFNYSLFVPIDGNRNKNLLHIKRLKKSMSENYIFTIIVVNENFEIIDGQHRFEVIKELNLPLYYIVLPGYGLKEVHILNQNAAKWSADDYLTGYCDLGYEDYIIYAKFKNKHKIGHNETMTLLSGTGRGVRNIVFYNGDFKVVNLPEAEDYIQKILSLRPYYQGVRRRSFIYTMISLFKNPNFDFDQFVQKLKIQPTALKDCTDTASYKQLIEEIYNYRRRDKINLRY